MTESSAQGYDHTVDLLVVGSGAGAMTTGIVAHDEGADVLLIEKSDHYGGSSAMSGGGLWIPCNHLMPGVGIEDNPDDAMSYLREITAGVVPDEKLQAYVDQSPQALRYLTEKAGVRMIALPEYADYYPRAKGSRPGGRALEPASFNARGLGDDLMKMVPQNPQMLIMNRIFMTIPEARTMLTHAPGWILLMFKLMFRYAADIGWRIKSKRDRNLAMGNSLVGMLRTSMVERNIPLWLETPARDLIVEDGRVVGAVVERNGRSVRVRANKGVVLAAGGFEGNQNMREKYLPAPSKVEWSCANKQNTGDAIEMAQAAGAAVELMDEGWWGPVTVVPDEPHARMLVIEKTLPGGVMVNKKGKRFVNEAAPYIDVVNAQYADHSPESSCVPCYLVFDATYRKNYPVGPMLPGAQQPDAFLRGALKKDYVFKANTIGELADQMGVDKAGLEETIAKMNEYAKTGKDLEFARGETVFDQYYGDETVEPNPCLGPIVKAPFYGMECFPGELGTKGGVKTDSRARALTESGEVVPGLYAIGNCSAAVMGRTYPGAGATLGPATTFGFIAARDALGK
jgi:3-oxosteroid 1-dehydrogenase